MIIEKENTSTLSLIYSLLTTDLTSTGNVTNMN